MKNSIKYSIMGIMVAMIGLLLFNSCKKNPTGPIGGSNQFDNSEMVTATFMGQVIKEDGSPLDGANISIGNHSFISDDDGFFYFSDINTPRNATLIKVEKPGYFDAFRTIRVIPNQDNQTRIMAMALPMAQTFTASSGGSITIANGGSIDFTANSIVDEMTGVPYNGTVSVYAKWIDPTSDDLSLLLPGDLRAVDNENQERGLTTYGMQAVELRDASGNELQLKAGSDATVHFPIHAALTSSAPQSIPLWSLNETTGMWEEDGVAQKSGSEYVGAVTHFSYWNCDDPWTLCSFQATFVDGNNNPIVGGLCKLIIQGQTANSVGNGWTNSNGIALGQIPINKTFDLEFYAPGCGMTSTQPLYTTTFSTGTANINLGTISAPSSSNTTTTITGTVEDCNNNLLANAPVKMSLGGWQVYNTITNASGVFSYTQYCLSGTPTATVTAYDVANLVNGSATSTITPNVTNNVGLVQACGMQNDFINWSSTIGATTSNFSINAPVGNVVQYYQTTTGISGQDNSPNNGIFSLFSFDGPQTVAGTHNLINFQDHVDSVYAVSPTIVNLTNYQAVGGKIEGSFSTAATGWNYTARPVTCNFRVTRSN